MDGLVAKTVLLGPQRNAPTVDAALEHLGVGPGPVAAITAGWGVREAEDLELGEHVGRAVTNLGLQRRSEDLFRKDPELRKTLRAGRDRFRGLQRLYRARLRHLGPAAEELLRLEGPEDLLEPERAAAMDQLAALDQHYLTRVTTLEAELGDRARLGAHADLQRHRGEIAEALDETRALCVAGGHVGLLYNRLWLFGVVDLVPPSMSIVAWSAGAMALADRIVLFHDRPPQGRGYAEALGPGLGVCPGIVPLPHAESRLRLDDPVRVQLLSRRFPDAICVALDEGSRVTWDGDRWTGIEGTEQLDRAGTLCPVGGGAR